MNRPGFHNAIGELDTARAALAVAAARGDSAAILAGHIRTIERWCVNAHRHLEAPTGGQTFTR